MTWGTFFVGAVVALVLVLAARKVYRDRKAGNPCGGCSGCDGCDGCDHGEAA